MKAFGAKGGLAETAYAAQKPTSDAFNDLIMGMEVARGEKKAAKKQGAVTDLQRRELELHLGGLNEEVKDIDNEILRV